MGPGFQNLDIFEPEYYIGAVSYTHLDVYKRQTLNMFTCLVAT